MSSQIVIQLVFYHDTRFLPGLIKSLKAQTFSDFYIVAIDNSQSQESSVLFQELCPDGEIIENDDNIGFSGGHNSLLKRTLELGAPYVLILNTDVELHKDFLKHLYTQLQRFPGVDACGPLIYNGVKGKRTKVVQNFRLYMNFKRGTKKAPDSGLKIQSCKQLPISTDVDYLSGVAMMLRTEIFSELHLWNENLFLYGEERDFFYRFSQQKRLAMVIRKAVCWHFHDWTTPDRKDLWREYYYLRRNKVLYFREHGFKSSLWGFLTQEIIKIPLTLIWSFRKKNPSLFFYYWLGIWHGLRNKTGRNVAV
jgi:GT2 family glycosyltransferase